MPKFIAGVGIFRTLTCGGWTYVTSTDDHDWHDIFMISYLVATIPWTYGCYVLSPPDPKAIKYRKIFAGSFFATIVPLVYFFIQHKVHKVAGGTLKLAMTSTSKVNDEVQPTPPTRSSSGVLSFLMLHSMRSRSMTSRASR